MKTAKERADEWVRKNIVLSEYCNIEYSDVMDSLAILLKEQDKITREACANACIYSPSAQTVEQTRISNIYHSICMNVKAI